MGIFRTVTSMFNDDVLIQETIKKLEDIYFELKHARPTDEPHDLLALVWLSRMATHGHDIHSPELHTLAFSETMKFACVAPPSCVRALALYIIYKEKQKVIESSPRYQQEYGMLMNPVFETMANGTMLELYAKYNPIHARDDSLPEQDAANISKEPPTVSRATHSQSPQKPDNRHVPSNDVIEVTARPISSIPKEPLPKSKPTQSQPTPKPTSRHVPSNEVIEVTARPIPSHKPKTNIPTSENAPARSDHNNYENKLFYAKTLEEIGDEVFSAKALEEITQGKTNKELWEKVLAESYGYKPIADTSYIRLRAPQLEKAYKELLERIKNGKEADNDSHNIPLELLLRLRKLKYSDDLDNISSESFIGTPSQLKRPITVDNKLATRAGLCEKHLIFFIKSKQIKGIRTKFNVWLIDAADIK